MPEQSIIQKAADEQAKMEAGAAPAAPPAGQPVEVETDDGMLRADGFGGGMFVAKDTPKQPAPIPEEAPKGMSLPSSNGAPPDDKQSRIKELEAELLNLQKPPAQPAPEQPPAQTTTIIEDNQTVEIMPGGTPMIGAPTGPSKAAQPQTGQIPPEQKPAAVDGNTIGYIAESTIGQGYALVYDNLSPAKLDQISFMAKYLAKEYPDVMRLNPNHDPIEHPALVMKVALTHLMADIRKTIAETATCSACNTTFNINELSCPNCNATNRCPTCKSLIGTCLYK